MIGQTIRGYKIIEEIGRGGMGVVYLAEDTRLQRKVALKFLKSHLYNSEKILEEARLASRVQHPGVVTIFDVVESDEGAFIVMEYVEGEPLSRFLKTHRLEMPVALKLAINLISVIDAAHRENLIHGDIKPSNIIITPDGNIKLLDFGLAFGLNDSSTQNKFSGTIPFSAPEQLTGANPSKQADIYAIGVVLYLLFTRQLPFEGLNQASQIYAITNQPPRPPKELVPHLPEELNHIILRCLEKQPSARFRTTATLLQDLQSIKADKPVNGNSVPSWVWVTGIILLIMITGFLGFRVYLEQTAPIKVNNYQEIELPQNTKVQINLFYNNTLGKDVQAWLYGLKEILHDKLSQINGLKPEISKPINLYSMPIKPIANELLCNISFTNEKNQRELKIEYFKGNQKHQKTISWDNFNEISWITQKVISDILFIQSGKKYMIVEESKPDDNKLLAYQYLSNGLFQLDEGLYKEAIENFNAALEYSPFMQQAHYYKGQALISTQEFEEAISSFIQSLPQADRSPLFDWQIKLSENPNPFWYTDDVLEPTINGANPASSFYFSEKGYENSYIIDIETRNIHKIKYPESFKNFLTLAVYKNGNEFNFLIHFKSKRYYRFVTYYPDKNKWEIAEPIVGSYQKILLPFLYFYDTDGNRVIRYHYKHPNNKTTYKIPFEGNNQFRISADGRFGVVFNTKQLAVINFQKEQIKLISDQKFWPSTQIGSPMISGEYLLFSDYNYSSLYIYNLKENQLEFVEQLTNHPRYSIKNSRLYRYFANQELEIFGFISRDNMLKIFYRGKEADSLRTRIYQLDKGEYVFQTPYTRFLNPKDQKKILLLDEENKRILVFNIDKPEPISIQFRIMPELRKIFIAGDHIFLITKDKLMAYDTTAKEIIWQLEGTFSLHRIESFPNFVAFFDSRGQRLSIYNLTEKQFYGFYPLPLSKKQIFFSKNYICYLSGPFLKVANLSSLLERDNLHAINIYKNIIHAYMALGQWENALKFADQGLKKYQPQLSEFLISRAQALLNLHKYQQVFNELPNLYNIYPIQFKRRKNIEYFLTQIGLYNWSSLVKLKNGFRFLESSNDYLAFCDHTSWRNSELQILRKKDGRIVKELEVGRNFSAFFSRNNKLFGYELIPQQDTGRFFFIDLNNSAIQQVNFTPESKIPNALLFPNPKNVDAFFALFSGNRTNINRLYKVDFNRNHTDYQLEFNSNVYATYWKSPVFYFNSRDTLFSLDFSDFRFKNKLIFLSTNGFYPMISIFYLDQQQLFGRTSRGRLIKIDLNTGQPEIVSNSIYFANEFGAFTRSHEIILWEKHGINRFKHPSPNKIIDFVRKKNDIFALEAYRLVQIRDQKIIAEYPLIWKAIKFILDNDKAFILSDSGILYSININQKIHFNENVKKGLILCLN